MTKKAISQRISAITKKIVEEYEPETIILFGSYAWGEPNEWSDLDLFVVKKTSKPRLKREQELRNLLSPHKIPMDIFVYTPSEVEESIDQNRNLFIEDIVRNGQVLFTKPGYVIQLSHRPAELIA